MNEKVLKHSRSAAPLGPSRSGVKALILAAGAGTRLKTLTRLMPKPMLPVGDRPLLEHTVDWLRSYGIYDIAINLHHMGEVITSHFGDGSSFGVRLTWSPEPSPLGTAGAVRKLANYFDGPALVVYGDLLTSLDLHRLLDSHLENRRRNLCPAMTLSLYEPLNPLECGVVDLDEHGQVLRIVEKPRREELFSTLSFSGVLVMDRELIDLIPADISYDFGYHLLPAVIARGIPVHGVPIRAPEVVIDIGTPDRYAWASEVWPHLTATQPPALRQSNPTAASS